MKSLCTLLVCALVGIALISNNVYAIPVGTIVDLTTDVTAEGMIEGAVFRNANYPIDGFGNADPRVVNDEAVAFLTFKRQGTKGDVKGYNTSAVVKPFDDVYAAETTDLPLLSLTGRILDGIGMDMWYIEFIIDVNENAGDKDPFTYLNDLRIYTSPLGGIDTVDIAELGQLRYAFQFGDSENQVKFDYKAASGGNSSNFDVIAFIPALNFIGVSIDDYVYVYAELGDVTNGRDALRTFTSDDFPEIPGVVPEPATLLIMAMGGLLIRTRRS